MTEKKKKILKEDDPKQSEVFRKSVRDLEAVGELSPIDGERALEDALNRIKAKDSRD